MKLLKFEIMSNGRGDTVHVYPEGGVLTTHVPENNRPGLLGARIYIPDHYGFDLDTMCPLHLAQTENFLARGEETGGCVKMKVGFLAIAGSQTYTKAEDFERDLPNILGGAEETPVGMYWDMGEQRMFHTWSGKVPAGEITCEGEVWSNKDKQPKLTKADVLNIFGKGKINEDYVNVVKGQALVQFFNNTHKSRDNQVAEELGSKALQTIIQWGERAVGPLATNAIRSAEVDNRQAILDDIILAIEDKLFEKHGPVAFQQPVADDGRYMMPVISDSPHAFTKQQQRPRGPRSQVGRGQRQW